MKNNLQTELVAVVDAAKNSHKPVTLEHIVFELGEHAKRLLLSHVKREEKWEQWEKALLS